MDSKTRSKIMWELIYAIILLIPCLSLPIGLFYIMRSQYINDKTYELLKDFFMEATQDKELMQDIYTIGGIFASGVKSGIGLQTKGGKTKISDILLQMAAQFIGQTLQKPSQEGSNIGTNPLLSRDFNGKT